MLVSIRQYSKSSSQMRYMQLMQTTRFVVFQLANFFLFFFSGKYLIEWAKSFQAFTTGTHHMSRILPLRRQKNVTRNCQAHN